LTEIKILGINDKEITKYRNALTENDVLVSAFFSKDNDLVLCTSKKYGVDNYSTLIDNTAHVWDSDKGQIKYILIGHSDHIYEREFSPDGRYIVTASTDKTIKIWNIENGKCISTIPNIDKNIDGIKFSPDGKWIIYTFDNILYVWDIYSNKCKCTIPEMKNPENIIVSTNYNTLFTTTTDDEFTKMSFWDISNGKCKHTLTQTSKINSCQTSSFLLLEQLSKR